MEKEERERQREIERERPLLIPLEEEDIRFLRFFNPKVFQWPLSNSYWPTMLPQLSRRRAYLGGPLYLSRLPSTHASSLRTKIGADTTKETRSSSIHGFLSKAAR